MSIRMTARGDLNGESSALLDPTASISSITPIEDQNDQVQEETNYKVYPQRWYILIVFTLFNAAANLLWNTWPPVQETCQLVFGWTKTNVLVIGALQAVGSIISVVPSSWYIDTKESSFATGYTFGPRLKYSWIHFRFFCLRGSPKGLRVAVITSLSLQVVGVLCEVLPLHPYWVRTTMITFGEFLISIAVPAVQNVGVVVLSATWFPPNERMTATAIATLASYLGSATSYIMGPYIVPDVDYGNITYRKGEKIDIDLLRNMTSQKHLDFLESKINEYILAECIILGILFFVALIYFPAKPPTPPCKSSAMERLDFCLGAKTLLKNRHFWLLLVVFGVSNGINWGWSSVQDLIFSHVGISQKAAGWLGFSGNIASLVAIIFSWYTDRMKRHAKAILIFLFVSTSSAQLVLTLACDQVIPLTLVVFYASGIAQMVFYSGTVPLIMEIAAECAFPVAEGITSGVLILTVYTINLFFFIGFMFPQASPLWMNWLLVGSSAFCIPLIACYRGTNNRLSVDLKTS
ncbi:hypothetical protein QZH41_012705 [Actinostola sp. cb2023]|nr:hypothetical protein QZH41_012705 [Actinostola sp. cb2023]